MNGFSMTIFTVEYTFKLYLGGHGTDEALLHISPPTSGYLPPPIDANVRLAHHDLAVQKHLPGHGYELPEYDYLPPSKEPKEINFAQHSINIHTNDEYVSPKVVSSGNKHISKHEHLHDDRVHPVLEGVVVQKVHVQPHYDMKDPVKPHYDAKRPVKPHYDTKDPVKPHYDTERPAHTSYHVPIVVEHSKSALGTVLDISNHRDSHSDVVHEDSKIGVKLHESKVVEGKLYESKVHDTNLRDLHEGRRQLKQKLI